MIIISTVRDAIAAGKESYGLRKAGKEPEIKALLKIPVVDFGYWPWTIEATLFIGESRELREAVKKRFYTLSDEEQHKMKFAPKHGGNEWVARAILWKKLLLPLPPKQYYLAISIIYRWYIRCLKQNMNERGKTHE